MVGHLYRRATKDLRVETAGEVVTIPAGALIDLHVYAVNADERVVGIAALRACPARTLPRGVPEPVMSFGDGHHRCPGAFIAVQETDIFLQHLLRLEGLCIARAPEVSWNELVKGYELRSFILSLGPDKDA